MRTQKRNGINSAAAPVPPAVSIPPASAEAPLTIPDIELRLSPRDLWFVATALRMTLWGGGEGRVMALRNIYRTCRLKTFDLSILPTARPSTPMEIVRLPHADVELLIRVMCGDGGNQAFSSDPGPEMSELVASLRETVKDTIKAAVAAKDRSARKL